MDVLPAVVNPHVDAIAHGEDGVLIIASSSLTGRRWNGSLWLFREPSRAPDVQYCSAGASTEAGTTDVKWIDSRRLVLASDSGSVDVWGLSGSCQHLENISTLGEHDNTASSVSVDCGKSKVVSSSWDRSIKVWDMNQETCIHTYRGHVEQVWSATCSRTEKDVFVSASQDGSIVLWDMRKEHPAKKLTGAKQIKSIPHCLDWSPLDSHVLAVGCEDGSISLFNVQDMTQAVLTYSPHVRVVNRVAFSPRSPEWLASVSDDTTVYVHDVLHNNTVLRSDEHKEVVRGLSWSPLDDSLCSSGWGRQLLNHTVGSVTKSSDLHVETSKSQATSTSMEVEGLGQAPINGSIGSPQCNGKNSDEENMDVESHRRSEQDSKSADSSGGHAERVDVAV